MSGTTQAFWKIVRSVGLFMSSECLLIGERLSVEKIVCESKWRTFDSIVARYLPLKHCGDSDYVRGDYIRHGQVSTIVLVRFNHVWS